MGGETVVTGSGSIVQIRLSNGSVTKILQNSKVIINDIKFGTKDSYAFGVSQGGLHSKVNKLASKSYYRVYTPTTVAGVRGTEFLVAVGVNGKSNAMVKEGVINLEGEEKRELVKGGEQAQVNMEDDISKDSYRQQDENKAYDDFQQKNDEIEQPGKTIGKAEEKLELIEQKNRQKLAQLKRKKKLSDDEKMELDFLYQKSVNQGSGLYTLSERIFSKYKRNPLVERNFYKVQRRLRSIEEQIQDMDQFIEKMSKEIEDFSSDVSGDIEDLEDNFIKN
jgi:hypothetical protein